VIILGTGKSVVKALEVLAQHKVDGKKVIVLTLFVTPDSEFLNCLHIYPTRERTGLNILLAIILINLVLMA